MPSIVDIHPHVISTDNKRYPLNPLGGVQSTWSRDRPTPFEALVAAMDKAGVAKAAIVQASTAYGHDNSYVAEAIAAHPKRFTGVFSVDTKTHVGAKGATTKTQANKAAGKPGLTIPEVVHIGDQVTVRYQEKNDAMIATDIRVASR